MDRETFIARLTAAMAACDIDGAEADATYYADTQPRSEWRSILEWARDSAATYRANLMIKCGLSAEEG